MKQIFFLKFTVGLLCNEIKFKTHRAIVISRSPGSTTPNGSCCASDNANNPGEYPPEYRNRASCLFKLGGENSLTKEILEVMLNKTYKVNKGDYVLLKSSK